jgi:PKD repeat protein
MMRFRGSWRLATCAPVVAIALVIGAVCAASASAEIDITITDATTSSVYATNPSQDANGLTTAQLAELVGVAPAENLTQMVINDGRDGPVTLDQSAAAFGYGTPPGYGVFSSGCCNLGYEYYTGPDGVQLLDSGSPMYVNISVSGNVLGVPSPVVVSPADPVLGEPVVFNEAGPIASDAYVSNSPAVTTGLMYSWDFGDGSTPTAFSSSSQVSHTFTTAGTYDVRVTVEDGASPEDAGVSPQPASVLVSRQPQSISFPQLGPFTFGQPPVVLSASATSGLAVAYSVASGPCTVSGSTLTLTGPGSCMVAAAQSGDTTWAPASPITSTIVVDPVPIPPVCSAQSVSVVNATATAIGLGCADGAGDSGDALSYAVLAGPAHGTLSGLNAATGAVTYTPSGTYSGADSFTFDATDAQGTAVAATVSIVVAPQLPPANTGPPAIAGPPAVSGTTAIGHSLSCSTGVWSGTAPLAYSYQWDRDGVPIAGATSAAYTITAADAGHSLTCAVTAKNAVTSVSAKSAAVAISYASDAFTLANVKSSKSGTVTIKLDGPDAGRFTAVATIPTSSATKKIGRAAKAKKPIVYGTRTVTATHAAALTLAISPTKQAKALLKKDKRLRVTITITFTPAGGQARTRTATLTVK